MLLSQFRAAQGFEFIEPAARSRKSNYDIDQYYRDALRVNDKKVSKLTKEFKPTQRFDYQFFNTERLDVLERKDYESKQKLYNLKLANRLRIKAEKKERDEAEKEERRKARYAQRKQRKLDEAAAAAAAGVTLPAADEKDGDKDSDSDAEEEAEKAAAAAPAAAATAAAAAASSEPVKMELDGEESAVKQEDGAAAVAASSAAAAATPAVKSEETGAAAKSESESVKMETDAAAGADTAAAGAAGRRKSGRARGKDAVTPSPAPVKAEGDDEEVEGDELNADLMTEAGCLTADERVELRALQEDGFGTWSRRHLISLTKAMEKYGRDDLSNIKVSVEEKTPEEVEKYYYAFWQKYKQIKEWDRIIKQVERGEQRLQKQKALQVIIDNKVKRFKNNFEKMSIPYPTTQQKSQSPTHARARSLSLAYLFSLPLVCCLRV